MRLQKLNVSISNSNFKITAPSLEFHRFSNISKFARKCFLCKFEFILILFLIFAENRGCLGMI